MERNVNIERCNIPMKQVFAQEWVKQAVFQAAAASLPAAVLTAGLPSSPRTLRQYIHLAEEPRLAASYLAQLEDIFAQADEIAPISIEDQYPWLKQEDWTLEMRDVSYYKITADLGRESPCNIKNIIWRGSQQTLCIESEDLFQLSIHVKSRLALLLFIKRLLLEGRADLELLQTS